MPHRASHTTVTLPARDARAQPVGHSRNEGRAHAEIWWTRLGVLVPHGSLRAGTRRRDRVRLLRLRRRCQRGHAGELDGRNRTDRRRLDATSSRRCSPAARWSSSPTPSTRRSRSPSKGAKRLANTKCAANQMTATEMAGYDADTGKLVARRTGRRAVLRDAVVDRGDRRQLGRPLGSRLRVGRDRARPDGRPLHDPAVLLDADQLLRPEGLDGEDAGRPRGQEDRRLRRLHDGGVPARDARPPGPEDRDSSSRTRRSSRSTPRSRGSRRPRRASSPRSSARSRSAPGRSRTAPP